MITSIEPLAWASLDAKWPVVDMFVSLSRVCLAPVVSNPRFLRDPMKMFPMSEVGNGHISLGCVFLFVTK